MGEIVAVINSGSGTSSPDESEARLLKIRQHLQRRIAPELLAIVPGDQIEHEMKRVAARKPAVLLVGGGDGTISTAAGVAAKSGVTLAILAIGTRNHFARDLGIPLDPLEAIGLLDRLKEDRVDLGEVNGHLFINNASLGLYPKVVRERDQTMIRRGWRKFPALAAAAAGAMRQLPQMDLTFQVDDQWLHCRTPFLFVGNNEYQGKILADSKRANLTSGCLWVCTARISNPLEFVALAWQGWASVLQQIEKLDTRTGESVAVDLRTTRATVAIDGENHVLETPLRFKIHRKALRVVMP